MKACASPGVGANEAGATIVTRRRGSGLLLGARIGRSRALAERRADENDVSLQRERPVPELVAGIGEAEGKPHVDGPELLASHDRLLVACENDLFRARDDAGAPRGQGGGGEKTHPKSLHGARVYDEKAAAAREGGRAGRRAAPAVDQSIETVFVVLADP